MSAFCSEARPLTVKVQEGFGGPGKERVPACVRASERTATELPSSRASVAEPRALVLERFEGPLRDTVRALLLREDVVRR